MRFQPGDYSLFDFILSIVFMLGGSVFFNQATNLALKWVIGPVFFMIGMVLLYMFVEDTVEW